MTTFRVEIEGDLLTVKVDLPEVARQLSQQAEQWRQAAEEARHHWEQSEWFLGEARATIARLEEELRTRGEAHEELLSRLEAAERDRAEALRHLEESRAACEELLRQAADLTEQLAESNERAEAARRRLEALERLHSAETNGTAPQPDPEPELEPADAPEPVMAAAPAANGDRRRATRTARADITVELERPDGAVLFRGPLRDISRTGMGFVSEELVNEAPELLWVTLHPAGVPRPIEAIARLAWLRQDDGSGRYVGGCELLDMPPGSRSLFEKVLEQPH